MVKVRQRDLPQNPDARAIVKVLAELTYNRHNDRVFSDFLTLTEIYLRRLPINTLHVVQHGHWPTDDGEDTEAWQRVTKGYKPKELKVFSQAQAMLMEFCDPTTHTDYLDLLGDIYQSWGFPSRAAGQFFTPYPIAKMCAHFLMENIDKKCRQAVAKAVNTSMWGMVWGNVGDPITARGKEQEMLWLLPHVYQHLEPVKIVEPAIGSGVMMLATAACCPRWAIDYGVVQFYGQDIDIDCVLMSRVNFMLYGLNGYYLKLTAAAMGVTPEGKIVDRKVDLDQRQPQPTVAPVEPAAPMPAPIAEPLPTTATPFVAAKPDKKGQRITLPPANQVTQLTIFDVLAKLDEPKGISKKQH